VDRLLDLQLVPDTQTSVLKLANGKVLKGVFLAKAPGKALYQAVCTGDLKRNLPVYRKVFGSPTFKRLLSRLDLLDAITAQEDRHAGNIFVSLSNSNDVRSVSAIDNDFSFPRKPYFKPLRSNYVYPGMSTRIERSVGQKVLNLTAGRLRSALAPVLGSQEIANTVARLRIIQAAIRSGRIRLVGDTGWASNARASGYLKSFLEQDRGICNRSSTGAGT
jgi:hypothetical protein